MLNCNQKLGGDIVQKVKRQHNRISPAMSKMLITLFSSPKNEINSQIALKTGLSKRRVIQARKQFLQTLTVQVTTKNRPSRQLTAKNSSLKKQVIRLLTENPYITLGGIKQQLQKKDISTSVAKLHRVLKSQRFSYKKLKYIPFSRNNNQVINKRQLYCLEVSKIKDQNLYFTDETSFNLKTAPNYGWSKVGQDSSIKIADKAGDTISVLAIINVKGLVGFTIIKGTARTENVETNFKNNVLPNVQPSDILIMDNVKSHHSQQIVNFIKETGLSIRYLPPYSPQLNPIENVFASIKARFRRIKVQKDVKTTNQLISAIKEVFQQFYGMDLSNYYRKMRQYIQIGIQKIPFDRNL